MIKTAVYLFCLQPRIKNCKHHKKVILLGITLTFRRRDRVSYHLFIIFLAFNTFVSFYHYFMVLHYSFVS